MPPANRGTGSRFPVVQSLNWRILRSDLLHEPQPARPDVSPYGHAADGLVSNSQQSLAANLHAPIGSNAANRGGDGGIGKSDALREPSDSILSQVPHGPQPIASAAGSTHPCADSVPNDSGTPQSSRPAWLNARPMAWPGAGNWSRILNLAPCLGVLSGSNIANLSLCLRALNHEP